MPTTTTTAVPTGDVRYGDGLVVRVMSSISAGHLNLRSLNLQKTSYSMQVIYWGLQIRRWGYCVEK